MSGNSLASIDTGAFRDVELSATLDLSDNARAHRIDRVARLRGQRGRQARPARLVDRPTRDARTERARPQRRHARYGGSRSELRRSGALSNLTRASGAAFALVDLGDNAISTVEDGAFAAWASVLDLSGNIISRTISGTFLRDAQIFGSVDLRYNQLTTIENGAFAGMRLIELRVDCNKVGRIYPVHFAILSSLARFP